MGLVAIFVPFSLKLILPLCLWQSTIDIHSYYHCFHFLFLFDFLVLQVCLIQPD